MKHQALFSSKDKTKNNKSVVCCNFASRLRVKLDYNIKFSVAKLRV